MFSVAGHMPKLKALGSQKLLLLFFMRMKQSAFVEGMSTEDEIALWQKDLTGPIDLRIDVAEPEEKRIGKVCRPLGRWQSSAPERESTLGGSRYRASVGPRYNHRPPPLLHFHPYRHLLLPE